MFCIEEGSIDHDIGIILHLGQWMVVIIHIHLDSLASSLQRQVYL